MPSYRLIKEAKLIKTDEFSSVFNFRKRIATEYLALHYQTNQLQRPRLGLVVGKKTAKLAVSRNYMRRVLRELFRLKQHEILAADIILRVQKKFEKRDFQLIQLEFNALVVKLNQRLARAEINHDKGHEA